MAKKKSSIRRVTKKTTFDSGEEGARWVLGELRKQSSQHDRDNLKRFGIDAPNALGVSMTNMKVIAKSLARDHDLADALWKTGVYEARMFATLIDEPALVTPAQMNRWCSDFDNWAICDTACFWLFDRTPHAWSRIEKWATHRGEFQKRAAFALIASLALHDKQMADKPFLGGLKLIETAANDERNFVKKGVNWALRGIGKRNAVLKVAAIEVAERLAQSKEAAPRWVGKDALRELNRVKR